MPPDFIVIHYTAGAEGPNAAENGHQYDTTRQDGTSCHFFTDSDSIFQEVDTNDRAHSALYNGNGKGIQIEMCGTLQTREGWLDPVSAATIWNTAKVCVWAMKTHNIPMTRLVGSQVRSGRGITGHVDCTNGFPEDNGTHTDPGTAFPYDVLFANILAIQQGESMALTQDDVDLLINGIKNMTVPRPDNINYRKADGTLNNSPSWPTSGGTSGPRFDYMVHLIGSKVGDIANALGNFAAAEAGRDAADATGQAANKAQLLAAIQALDTLDQAQLDAFAHAIAAEVVANQGNALTPEDLVSVKESVTSAVGSVLGGLHGTWEAAPNTPNQ